MKDLGELLGLSLDSNQKIVKDPTKPLRSYGDEDARAEDARKPKPEARKKPTGVEKRFKKIKKALNVEIIPGTGYHGKVQED